MKYLKNHLLLIALMAIGSYTATTHSAQSTPAATNQIAENAINQSTDSTVFATKTKTRLPF